jgi:hypothetical protein
VAGSHTEAGMEKQVGRQESVGWQGQAEERGWPAEAGRQAGGRQAEMGDTGTKQPDRQADSLRQGGVEVGGQKEAGSRGRQGGKRDRVAQSGK